MLRENSTDHIDITELQRLGHAMSDNTLSPGAMGQDSLLRVFYPKTASRLLRNDIVILDRYRYVFLVICIFKHFRCLLTHDIFILCTVS